MCTSEDPDGDVGTAVSGSAPLWGHSGATQEPQEEVTHTPDVFVTLGSAFSSPSSALGHLDPGGLISLGSPGSDTHSLSLKDRLVSH